ncbi:MFS transporter [Streptomyces cacaoi]|uniref:MFS transporter n=1 Tax=Streptomyces cacaoi TaxID=1898 RepID=UPI002619C2B3|nr:MFS transporter [Streptomyces cacaoi]
MTGSTRPAPGRRSFRPVAGLLAAIAVSLTGTRISAISIPWFVLVTSGSAAQTGVVAFFEMAPYVLVKAFAGPLVDRAGPRVVSWTTDLVSAGAAAAVPLLHTLGQLSYPVLLGLVCLIGAARGPGDSAKQIMVPEVADRGRIPLERATGMEGIIERLASTVGPAAGGALVAAAGPLTGLTVNAACFALGSLIIAVFLPRGTGRPVPPSPSTSTSPSTATSPGAVGADRAGQPGQAGYWRRFGEGFAFLRRDPLLLTVITVIGLTNFLDAAFMSVLLPVWAHDSGHGPAAIGQVNAAQGVLAIGGSFLAATFAHRLPRRLVFFVAFLFAGAPRFLVLATDLPLWAVLGVFAIGGFGAGFVNPILGAISFERVPRPLLGRVKALGDSLAWTGIPLGGLAAGAAVTSLGLAPVLVVCGAAYFLTTNLAALRSEWKEMDRTRGKGAAPVPLQHETSAAPPDRDAAPPERTSPHPP